MTSNFEAALNEAPTPGASTIWARLPLILTVAFRNLSYDKLRLLASISGIAFAVLLVGVQLGLFFGAKKMIASRSAIDIQPLPRRGLKPPHRW